VTLDVCSTSVARLAALLGAGVTHGGTRLVTRIALFITGRQRTQPALGAAIGSGELVLALTGTVAGICSRAPLAIVAADRVGRTGPSSVADRSVAIATGVARLLLVVVEALTIDQAVARLQVVGTDAVLTGIVGAGDVVVAVRGVGRSAVAVGLYFIRIGAAGARLIADLTGPAGCVTTDCTPIGRLLARARPAFAVRITRGSQCMETATRELETAAEAAAFAHHLPLAVRAALVVAFGRAALESIFASSGRFTAASVG